MLARLQRRLMFGMTLAALLAGAGLWWAQSPRLAVAVVLVATLSFTVVLAIEFVLLACVHRADPTPRAGAGELLRAWAGECVIALRVFGWRQPFRSRVWPDVPGRPGVRGIVFVHGYLCNRGLWNPWLARCTAQQRPCVAVDLEPVFSELDAYLPALDRAVERLERETGLAPLLVCHSMGGLVARSWLAATPGAALRVHRIITIGTPHGGTWLARLSRSVNAVHMRQTSDWLRGLGAREPAGCAARFTCFYSHADNIVFPPLAAVLPGSDARHLRATAHMAMAFHPEVFSEVDAWLTERGPPGASDHGTAAAPR
jgi:triacylglycerol lipase